MVTLIIPYYKLPSKPSEVFPEEEGVWRPLIELRINYKTAHFDCLALLDSGADNCLFPAEVGEYLGIRNIRSGKTKIFGGIGKGAIKAYFHDVLLRVRDLSFKCRAGFTYDKMPCVLLGQKGFFDQCIVNFDLPGKVIRLSVL